MSDGDAEPDEEAEPDPTAGPDPPERRVSDPGDGSEGSTNRDARDDASGDDVDPGPGVSSGNGAAGGQETDGSDRASDPEGASGSASPAGPRETASAPGPGREAVAGNRGAATGDESPPEGIDVGELTGPVRRLDPKVRYVWVLGSVMGALTLGGIAGVAGFVVLDRPLVGPAVFLALLGLGAVLAVLRYRSWSYEVREDSLYLERGVLTRTRTVVPYVRIQHVDASRGPVERALGLATAVVYTAGSRGADVSIPGLTTDRADDLQERLKRLAIAAEGEDAV